MLPLDGEMFAVQCQKIPVFEKNVLLKFLYHSTKPSTDIQITLSMTDRWGMSENLGHVIYLHLTGRGDKVYVSQVNACCHRHRGEAADVVDISQLKEYLDSTPKQDTPPCVGTDERGDTQW